ncbi:hypothetical protein CKC_05530 [Candidatus Liberibacter solanacearum CLso-ZC1]|uniref:Uncharacterized protein n=1 Tax=Liberibacter solanacearum (strain CLso-ZC1) TaxID=658172 RepID=E4UE23_LIBSC|nr:hypothetical protein [Candidatus Liberibacter solanacearum]ADR52851.1 hypothetical protein CKC_05530 [Candidatus Liberibacter solanacearum CLso-ZC1]
MSFIAWILRCGIGKGILLFDDQEFLVKIKGDNDMGSDLVGRMM